MRCTVDRPATSTADWSGSKTRRKHHNSERVHPAHPCMDVVWRCAARVFLLLTMFSNEILRSQRSEHVMKTFPNSSLRKQRKKVILTLVSSIEGNSLFVQSVWTVSQRLNSTGRGAEQDSATCSVVSTGLRGNLFFQSMLHGWSSDSSLQYYVANDQIEPPYCGTGGALPKTCSAACS